MTARMLSDSFPFTVIDLIHMAAGKERCVCVWVCVCLEYNAGSLGGLHRGLTNRKPERH